MSQPCQAVVQHQACGYIFDVPCCDKAKWIVIFPTGEFLMVCDMHRPRKMPVRVYKYEEA